MKFTISSLSTRVLAWWWHRSANGWLGSERSQHRTGSGPGSWYQRQYRRGHPRGSIRNL